MTRGSGKKVPHFLAAFLTLASVSILHFYIFDKFGM